MNRLLLLAFLLFATPSYAATITRYVNAASAGGDGTTSALSGANAAYASYSAFEAAEAVNLDTANNSMVVNCAGATADTTAANTTGWTMSATDTLTIQGDYVPPTSGSLYSTSYYRIEVTDATAFTTDEDYVFVDKIQVFLTTTGTGGYNAIYFNAGNGCRLSNSIVKASHAVSTSRSGIIYLGGAGEVCHAWNNVIIDINNGAAAVRHITAGTMYVYSNTVHNATYSLRASVASGMVAKNNIFQSGDNNEYVNGTLESTSGYNISESATQAQLVDVAQGSSYVTDTTDGTSASKLIDSSVNFTSLGIKVGNIVRNTTDTTFSRVTAIDSATQLSLAHNIMVSGEGYIIYTNLWGAVTFVDEASDNFLLGSTDTLAINNGIDTSGEAAPLNFTTDIQGETRATWDIGADEYVAAGAARRIMFIN